MATPPSSVQTDSDTDSQWPSTATEDEVAIYRCKRCGADITAKEKDAHRQMHLAEGRKEPSAPSSVASSIVQPRVRRPIRVRKAVKRYDKAAHHAYKKKKFNSG